MNAYRWYPVFSVIPNYTNPHAENFRHQFNFGRVYYFVHNFSFVVVIQIIFVIANCIC